MMETFSILNSRLQLAVIILPIALLLFVRTQGLRQQALALLGLPLDSRGKTLTRICMPLLVLAMLIFALLRPSTGYEEIDLPTPAGRDVLLLMDVSSSMLARDESPSRLEAAKRKAEDTLALLKEHARGDRIGAVLFAGAAYMYLPPTSDYGVARTFLRSIEADLISSPGSSLTAALERAVLSLPAATRGGARLILMSDGEDGRFSLDEASRILKENALKLNVLGFGTPEGAPIDTGGGRLLKDRAGNIVVSKLKPEALRSLASASGGLYFKAGIDDTDLRSMLSGGTDIRPDFSSGLTAKHRNYHELGPLLCGIVLLLIACSSLMPPQWRVLALLLLVTLAGASSPASAEAGASSTYEAARAYKDKDYAAALTAFEKAVSEDPNDSASLQALASTYYKLGRFDDAAKAFEKLVALGAARGASPRERYESTYNSGNALLQAGQADKAVSRYEQALKIKPGDSSTEHNLKIAKEVLEEKKQQEEEKKQKQQQTPEPSPAASPSASPDGTPSASPSTSPEDSQEQQSEDQKDQQKDASKENQDKAPEQTPGAERQTPEPAASATAEASQAEGSPTPGGDPNPAPEMTAAAQATEEPQSSDDSKPAAGGLQQYDASSLKEREARAWLESLPESPVLLQRQEKQSGRNTDVEQSW